MTDANYWTAATSRRTLLRSGALLGAGLGGAALVGCSDDDGEPSNGETPGGGTASPGADGGNGGSPRQGGRLGLSQPVPRDTFNPITDVIFGWYYSGQVLYDRLISTRLDEQYVLEAAESIELTDDTTVVARLKEGLVYQDKAPVDGRAVTAEDIVVLQEYIRDEPEAGFGGFQKDVMESVEAQDDRTVVFNLRRPSAYIFTGSQLSQPSDQCIIPRELVEGGLDQMEPVGSGPYQLSEYQFGVRYLYQRNPTYRGAEEDLPYIDERELLSLADSAAIEATFRSGQIGVWIPPQDTVERITNDLGEEIVSTEALDPSLETWNMSGNREIFSDVRVREAIWRLFNQEQFIELSYGGAGEITPGELPTALSPYLVDPAETEEFRRYDPEAARQLLDAAGFDFNRVYEMTTIAGAINSSNTQIWQQQLAEAGIETTISALDAGEWLSTKTSTGEYDFCIVSHPSYDSPQTPLRLHHTESQNINAWMAIADPEIDAMIEASEVELDPEAQIQLVKDVQLELMRRYANLGYTCTPISHELRYAYIKDWETNIAAQPMYRTEAWLDV